MDHNKLEKTPPQAQFWVCVSSRVRRSKLLWAFVFPLQTLIHYQGFLMSFWEHVCTTNLQLCNFQNVYGLLLKLTSRFCHNWWIIKEKISQCPSLSHFLQSRILPPQKQWTFAWTKIGRFHLSSRLIGSLCLGCFPLCRHDILLR